MPLQAYREDSYSVSGQPGKKKGEKRVIINLMQN